MALYLDKVTKAKQASLVYIIYQSFCLHDYYFSVICEVHYVLLGLTGVGSFLQVACVFILRGAAESL